MVDVPKTNFRQEPLEGSKRHVFKRGMPQGVVSGRLSAQKKDSPSTFLKLGVEIVVFLVINGFL